MFLSRRNTNVQMRTLLVCELANTNHLRLYKCGLFAQMCRQTTSVFAQTNHFFRSASIGTDLLFNAVCLIPDSRASICLPVFSFRCSRSMRGLLYAVTFKIVPTKPPHKCKSGRFAQMHTSAVCVCLCLCKLTTSSVPGTRALSQHSRQTTSL